MSTIAVLSFPGMNCEVETLRALRRNSCSASIVRWNAPEECLASYDAYVLPGGFSYEDRGRAGMVAAHHPLMPFLAKEAEKGKTIIGICNGAQILVESGLIPLGNGLRMALAKNQVSGFRNEWLWIRRTCQKGRCIGSDVDEILHLPIAHGEGRFQTRDTEVITELQRQDLIAFSYCTSDGTISDTFPVNPNGSIFGIAGLCNRAGNILALMPHPERTRNGDPFFQSIHRWLTSRTSAQCHPELVEGRHPVPCFDELSMTHIEPNILPPDTTEIFIDTVITNNEERTIEATLRNIDPKISLKQFRYIALQEEHPNAVLRNVMLFNPHRDIAYVRRRGQWFHWNSRENAMEPLQSQERFQGILLLRRDREEEKGKGKETPVTGICYLLRNIYEHNLYSKEACEILANPHASTLERLPGSNYPAMKEGVSW